MKAIWIKLCFFMLCLPLLAACNDLATKSGEDLEISPEVGYLAPDFSLTALDGSTIKLNDLHGNAVFINFWTTTCRYCQYEMRNIQSMHETYASKGLIVLSINIQDTESDVAAYINRMKITFPVLLDSDGKVSKTYLVEDIPHSYFIDRDGVVKSLYLGEMTKDEMEKQVQLVLK